MRIFFIDNIPFYLEYKFSQSSLKKILISLEKNINICIQLVVN